MVFLKNNGMARTLRLFLLLFLFSTAFVFISFKAPYAASDGIQILVDKLDRLEKDLNGLQKYVFKGVHLTFYLCFMYNSHLYDIYVIKHPTFFF